MYFKGKQREFSFNSIAVYAILAWAIIMGLLVIFLSSAPAGANVPAIERIEYTVPVLSEVLPQPVPYTYWDTSTWLNGWYDQFATQLAIGVIDDAIAVQELREQREALSAWREDGSNWRLAAIIIFLVIVSFGLAYSAQKDYWGGKR